MKTLMRLTGVALLAALGFAASPAAQAYPYGPPNIRYWRGGHWHHGFYHGRMGWWWVSGGVWYFYTAPVYPYPDPYVPPVVVQSPPVVVQSQPVPAAPAMPPAPPAPAQPEAPAVLTPQAAPAPSVVAPQTAPQVWYYCQDVKQYYPYVSECPGGWKTVPATAPQ